MKKKIAAMTLAVCMVFGSAAALPYNVFDNSSGITASAYDYYEAGGYKYRILADGTVEIAYFQSDATYSSITVPAKIGGRTVTVIGDYAFSKKKISTITIPEGVKSIGICAFEESAVKTINIPSTVTNIKNNAFVRSHDLMNINVSSANKTYATVNGALLNKAKTVLYNVPNARAVSTYTVPSGVQRIGEYAIWECQKLKTVTLPDSVKTLDDYAIYNCPALETVNFGAGFEKGRGIGDSYTYVAIKECGNLKAFNISSANKKFSSVDGVVYNKNKTELLKFPLNKSTLTIPSTVTKIKEYAVGYTKSLTRVYIPNNVKTIEKYAFAYGEKLSSVIFTNGLTELGMEAFRDCNSLTGISLPKGLKTMYGEQFFSCNKLSGVNLSSTIDSLYGLDFKYTSVKDIYIPSSVKLVNSNDIFNGDCVIYGQKNSPAQEHAQRYGYTFKEISQPVTRFAGAGRYDTAKTISAEGITSSSKTVVLAYGMNYADALAGVPLATDLKAPILLTNKDALPEETLGEIKRLGATKVIILGGEGAVSDKVANVLRNNKITVERIAGNSRYGTATKIAKKLNSEPTEIFFVYGLGYADALSVSTAAAAKKAPIIYLSKSGELDAETASYLKSVKGKVKKAYVIGGIGVISDNMLKKAGDALGLSGTAVERVFGANRYSTCVEINKRFAGNLTGKSLCIATGKNFPDALAGGVLAAMNKAPLFLADTVLSAEQKTYLNTKKATNFYVFGGTGAVPNSLVYSIGAASK